MDAFAIQRFSWIQSIKGCRHSANRMMSAAFDALDPLHQRPLTLCKDCIVCICSVNDAKSKRRWLASPSFFIQTLDWYHEPEFATVAELDNPNVDTLPYLQTFMQYK